MTQLCDQDMNQRVLLVMRHAKSSWDDANLNDHDRPLNERGRRDATRMAQFLSSEGCFPDLIISSTAKRATETVEYVRRHLPAVPDLVVTRQLYLAGAETIQQVIRRHALGHRVVLVVGHNPGLQEFVERWLGPVGKFSTAALARMAFELESWDTLDQQSVPTSAKWKRPRELDES